MCERKKLIAGIHIKKQQLGLDEESYREILKQRYNVSSSKDLNTQELREFAASLGFYAKKQGLGSASRAQISTITKLYKEVAKDKSELGLRRFIKRIVGRMPLYLESLELKEAQKVIVGLKKWGKGG